MMDEFKHIADVLKNVLESLQYSSEAQHHIAEACHQIMKPQESDEEAKRISIGIISDELSRALKTGDLDSTAKHKIEEIRIELARCAGIEIVK